MPKIFLSYRREDSEHVTGRIFDRLTDRFGREAVFMDIDTIPFGVDFRKHLDLAVGQCDILLAVIGESWVEARHKEGARL
ncbi:MAG TPA: toll/interleukin-1 receptor domain-containing protein, partial [Isosphaeraceae bacterium]|nr:toll/interleukin-1 receptor domain-containing protein [Isosphaeraceae bacterium]